MKRFVEVAAVEINNKMSVLLWSRSTGKMRCSGVVKIENACCPTKVAVKTPQRTKHTMVLASPHAQAPPANVKGIMNIANMPATRIAPTISIANIFFRMETPGFGCIEGRENI